MKNKKKTLLRILLYLVLTYVPVYILGFAFSDKNGSLTSVFAGNTLMLYPAIAVIITRLVTKEGFRNSFLGFGKRNSSVELPFLLLFVKRIKIDACKKLLEFCKLVSCKSYTLTHS